MASDMQNKELASLLDAIAEHTMTQLKDIRAGKDGAAAYPLPAHILDHQIRFSEIPPGVGDVFEGAKTATLAQLSKNSDTVGTAVQRYVDGQMSQKDFNKLIDKVEDDNADQFNQLMSTLKGQLTSLGSEHPNWMQIIANTFTTVAQFLSDDVWAKDLEFLQSLVESPAEWANKVEAFFQQVLSGTVTDWWRQTFG
ncbi:hypothetical protein [Nocardia sp. NBC_01009]|uniref:hypothetical protein n=1 Tax=Nocardia sp. NBC_01009 TaxID=2975996 RepID=UPI00386654A5|nr:hypothetical protein OHA42_30255 [Nocardia sp. NBC_01009]